RVRVRSRHHVLLDGHVEEEPERLERAGDPAGGDLVRVEAEQAPALELDLARIRRVDARDQVEERRLAGAVRPDHAHDLALVDVEVEPVDHAQAAEGERDALQLEQRHQTISTRRSPSSPLGRRIIRPIRIRPSTMYRAGSGFESITFSQTKAAR